MFDRNKELNKNIVQEHMLEEEFEDTKGVIRIRISKKNRQHNGQKQKDKQRSTKHTHKTKDRLTRTPLKTRGELGCYRDLNEYFPIFMIHNN